MAHKTNKKFLSKESWNRATYGKKLTRGARKYPRSLIADSERVIYVPPKHVGGGK